MASPVSNWELDSLDSKVEIHGFEKGGEVREVIRVGSNKLLEK